MFCGPSTQSVQSSLSRRKSPKSLSVKGYETRGLSQNPATVLTTFILNPHPQVSKDLVPVIYHEFELCASITAKNGADAHLVDMPVKNLTLNQLQHLKTHHPHEKSSGIKVFSDLEDHQV